MSIKFCCDFCGMPLIGYNGRYVNYKTNELDTSSVLTYLCKDCAKALDDILVETKTRRMTQEEIEQRVSDLHKERSKNSLIKEE